MLSDSTTGYHLTLNYSAAHRPCSVTKFDYSLLVTLAVVFDAMGIEDHEEVRVSDIIH